MMGAGAAAGADRTALPSFPAASASPKPSRVANVDSLDGIVPPPAASSFQQVDQGCSFLPASCATLLPCRR